MTHCKSCPQRLPKNEGNRRSGGTILVKVERIDPHLLECMYFIWANSINMEKSILFVLGLN